MTDVSRFRAIALATEAELDDATAADERAEILREAAENWFEAKDFDKAFNRFTLADDYSPERPASPFHIAAALASGQDCAQALLDEYLAGDPKSYDWQGLGMAFHGIGELQQALTYHSTALRMAVGNDRVPSIDRIGASFDIREAMVAREAVRIDLGLEPDEFDLATQRWSARHEQEHPDFDLDIEEDLDQFGLEVEDEATPEPYVAPVRPGRNEPCHCGSGKKYKKCCLATDTR